MTKARRKFIPLSRLQLEKAMRSASKALRELPGVQWARLGPKKNGIIVYYDFSLTGLEAIDRRLREAGIMPGGSLFRKFLYNIELYKEHNEKAIHVSKPTCCSKVPRKP